MKKYVKTNIFPIIIELIFIISCFIVPREYYIYTNFGFYLILALYFWCRKDFSLKEWLHNLKSGKKFWKLYRESIGKWNRYYFYNDCNDYKWVRRAKISGFWKDGKYVDI